MLFASASIIYRTELVLPTYVAVWSLEFAVPDIFQFEDPLMHA